MSAPAAADSHPSRRAKALTDIAIQKLKPREQRYEVGDPGARGLRVVVQPSGTKSYILRYRFGGKPEKFTIGSILIGLAAARAEASKAIYEITQGRDPAAAKRASKEEQKLATLALVDTFRSVAQRYLKIEGSKLRSAETFRKTLERLVFDTLGDRAIADIKRSEIVSLLDRIETERGPAAAHAALAIVRRIMNWHAVRSDNFRTPIVKGMARVSVKERARTAF